MFCQVMLKMNVLIADQREIYGHCNDAHLEIYNYSCQVAIKGITSSYIPRQSTPAYSPLA